ncbi:MAG: hydrogenase maturation nickel metallochaperone HypA [Methylococcaceae bacterium]|nr:hydrogenase maturation nickel metallochaperone HypA [Methylococcaceae bacterium]
MHELSLCQDLIDQVTELARRHGARSVARVKVQIGTLAGVEPVLLESAFTIARAGTVAEAAEMVTEVTSPRVLCLTCGRESETRASRLCCASCDSSDTRLIRGDELILAQVELVVEDDESQNPPLSQEG